MVMVDIAIYVVVFILYSLSCVGAFRHALSNLVDGTIEKDGISYKATLISTTVWAILWPLCMMGMYIQMAFEKGE